MKSHGHISVHMIVRCKHYRMLILFENCVLLGLKEEEKDDKQVQYFIYFLLRLLFVCLSFDFKGQVSSEGDSCVELTAKHSGDSVFPNNVKSKYLIDKTSHQNMSFSFQ